MIVEDPQSHYVSSECEKAAWQNGFRRPLGKQAGWAGFGSTTAEGTLHLAAAGAQGPWLLALDHAGVIEALADEFSLTPAKHPGPGLARYAFEKLGELYAILPRLYQLAASLPTAPLAQFEAKTADMPRATEEQRLGLQRIGQDVFRKSLLDYWKARCPLTGITDPALLRASHIIPWAACASDADRLDVKNGLLLSALWDAAFDRGLVTFDDDGHPVYADSLSETARAELRWQTPISLTTKHRQNLAWHRANQFQAR